MENPYEKESQAEFQNNWHRQIPTATYRALAAAELSSAEHCVIIFIIDRSWGFQKDCCKASLTDICNMTGFSRVSIAKSMKSLEEKKVIVVDRVDGKTNRYLFNKYWDTWLVKWRVSTETSKLEFTSQEESHEGTSKPEFTSQEENKEGTSKPEFTGLVNQSLLPSKPELTSTSKPELTRLVNQPATKAVARKKVLKESTKESTLKKVLKEKKIPVKEIYGEFKNVQLSLDEYQKLLQRFGEIDAQNRIEELSSGIASKGYKYTNHYATIINWSKRNGGKRGHNEGHESESGDRWRGFERITGD